MLQCRFKNISNAAQPAGAEQTINIQVNVNQTVNSIWYKHYIVAPEFMSEAHGGRVCASEKEKRVCSSPVPPACLLVRCLAASPLCCWCAG